MLLLFQGETGVFSKEDTQDIIDVLRTIETSEEIATKLTKEQRILITSQLKNATIKDRRLIRWDKR